jgi:hypothetical protein
VQQTLHGIDRVSTIVRATKAFSHPGHQQTFTIRLRIAGKA